MFNYPRGSEWRKWDLHVHSTASDGTATPAEIIAEAKAKGLSVIALTDHHTVSNIDEIHLLGEAEGITVISGIEFRTEYGAKSVHMIGLFPEEHNGIKLNQDALNELVLSPLNLSRTRIMAEGRKVNPNFDDEKAFKEGIFHVQVDFKSAADKIHQLGGIVTVHAGNKSNSIEEMKHKGSGVTNVDLLEDSLGPVKEELLKEHIDVCEVQKCSETAFYLNTFGKPSIAASDAHSQREVGTKFTWIKADPSFNGLLQIKFEPEQRTCIQEEKPGQKADYSIIDRVTIKNPDFSNGEDTTIYFNSDLTCIIGGKSTGKSLLLNNIAYAIDNEQVEEKYQLTRPENKKRKDETKFSPINGVTVHWADGHTSSIETPANKKIVYIPQTYLNRLSDEREETTEVDTIIQGILLQDESIRTKYEKLETSSSKLKIEIDRLLYDYLQLDESIKTSKDKLLENNSSDAIQKEIQKLEGAQKAFLDEGTISEEQSQRYNFLHETLQQRQDDKTAYVHDKGAINDIEKIQMQVPVEVGELQSLLKGKVVGVVEALENQVNKAWEEQKKELLREIDACIEKCEEEIKEAEEEIEELRPIVERNATFIAISAKISKEKAKLNEALKTEIAIGEQEARAEQKLDELVNKFFLYKKNCDEVAAFVNETKSESVEGLHFRVETVLRSDAIRTRLLEAINNKTLSKFKMLDITQITEENFSVSVLKELVLSLLSKSNDSLCLKAQYMPSVFLGELFSNWYNMNYIVRMDEDDFEKMSPGKKALVLLKLLIGLANSDCPMLIDQPEDDLDNRSIFDDLVKYIKEKKIARQIIIVTHNANIVVGADSDEIIVANQDGQNTPNANVRFEYVSGAIENSWKKEGELIVLHAQGIKEHICEVLEGGEKAFEKRKNKYCMEP